MRTTLALLTIAGIMAAADLAMADPKSKATTEPQPRSASPNFIILMTDDQSWVGTSALMDPDVLSSKSDYYRTPNIERLMSMGMKFTRGYSPAPYCCPTRRSLIIGQTPARHVYQKDQPGWVKQYRKQLSLPRMLKKANPDYRTAHFGKWDFRFDSVSPKQMGYDVSDGKTGNDTGGGKNDPRAGKPDDDPKLIYEVTNRTIDFMKQSKNAGKPFFVQVSHYAVHLGILYRQKSLDAAGRLDKGQKHNMPTFAAMTADVDDGIGLLLDSVKSLGLADNTYIFFLSDNGGRLTMPGQKKSKSSQPRNFPLRDGKGGMYEGGLRVPFGVVGPGIKAGSVCRVPATGLDFFPTIAELAGYKPALPQSLDGGSLTEVLKSGGTGRVKRNNPFLVFHQAVARKAESAIMMGDYKLVKTWTTDTIELFDLAKDIGEANDLSKSNPDKAAELHSALVGFLNDVGAETTKNITKPAQRKLFE